jgi:hypothetical protein
MRLIAFVWTRRLLGDWPGVEMLFERNPDFLLQLPPARALAGGAAQPAALPPTTI